MSVTDVQFGTGMDPAVSVVWNAVEVARTRTLNLIRDMSAEQLSRRPGKFQNSIAALVTHVAGTEINFAHRFSGTPVPDDLKAEFLLDRPQSPLPQPEGETVASLTARLEKSRGLLKAALEEMTHQDFDRIFTRPDGTQVTFRYFMAILAYHGTLHLGHMQMIKQHLE